MNYLNYEFFDEFKALDNLCRDIYGKSMDHKLSVTLYLEDMEKNNYQGLREIPSWSADYYRLKKARNLRNELAHSNNSFSYENCSEEDIYFIRSFRARILNQTDPIALLKKQNTLPIQTYPINNIPPIYPQQAPHYPQPTYNHNTTSKSASGCLGIVATFLGIVTYVIILLL
jgi:hypothetical protein